jgi:hypothetical protein
MDGDAIDCLIAIGNLESHTRCSYIKPISMHVKSHHLLLSAITTSISAAIIAAKAVQPSAQSFQELLASSSSIHGRIGS